MGIISVEQENRLYWLGRYAERVYTTVRIYFKSFDSMIDEFADSYHEFCQMIDIPDIYKDKDDFMTSYPFDEKNPDSIISNLNRAYDNAIVLRENIGSESLSYIQLAIYEMNKAKNSDAPLIEMQQIIDDILAFWGIVDDQIEDNNIRNIIKAGKRIERIDIYARLGVGRDELLKEVHRMVPRVEKSGINYDRDKLASIQTAFEKSEINYYEIVNLVETLYA